MVKKKKLRLKRKVKNFLIFYAFICISVFANYTFSRYIETSDDNFQVSIANFNVTVNDVNVLNNEPFDIELSPNSNSYENKLMPNNSGYFEIIINPKGTEVSLEYELLFNMENLDSDIVLTKCILNDEEQLPFTGTTIKGDLLMKDLTKGFTDEDILNIKVYWEWNEEEDIINPVIDDTRMKITSIVKQKID